MNRDEILLELRTSMSRQFELDPAAITPEATLFEDLDLDSIDAVDMAAKMQQLTGARVEDAALRQLRTVADMVDLIERLQR